ncbi:DNA mismatch repair protein MutS [Natronorarus salvus]|uniref:DNA mismatch repair protein MutS n=1 Tax=Natronorarus salvus TaxID=3117733 RepID=UPI002F2655D5
MTEVTGIVGEFFSLKEESGADLLMMQCGDFYEFFGEDAERVAAELDLRVSQKSSHGSSYPMAGVPVSELTPYLKALVERGFRVAVAQQYETEEGLAREIVRVATPGTLLETSDAEATYIASVVRSRDRYGLAFADVTTGRFLVTDVESAERAVTECYRFAPVEVLCGPGVREEDGLLDELCERTGASPATCDEEAFAPGRATHRVREQFGRETVSSLGLKDEGPAVTAAGAVLAYVEETGVGVLASMTRLTPYTGEDHVSLDATTQRNLELTETMTGGTEGSLLATIDHTVTSAGGRLLVEWLRRPRRSLATIERRQASVAALCESALAREELREVLGTTYDLARLASRASHGSADANALLRVRDSIAVLPRVRETVERDPRLADSPLREVLADLDSEAARVLHDELEEALAEEPPKTLREGGLIRRGYDEELDDLIERHEDALGWIETLADREKREHGLSHVQVNRNSTEGYTIQVGRSAADDVPEQYERVKELKNSVRFTIPELAERERDVLRLEESRGELEYELFCELRDRVAGRAELLQDAGRALAAVDTLCSLATHAAESRWVRPEVVESGSIEIERGRHPVVEAGTEFVPNDARLDGERRVLLVTGPNMSGKSTYMRQVALILLLAQIGSFVPAESARIGLVDGIYTRVGALDELAGGRSTFMVEMAELSNILHGATEKSLVILDEVGRGTSTFDGVAIAWATTEYLHNEVGATTLFATHYHELTALADHLDGVANVHVAAEERDGDVTFLRTVREGPTDRSYGVHVADLAGVPAPVVERSRDVLDRLREEKPIEARGGSRGTQQVVFDVGSGSMRTATADGDDEPDGGSPEPEADPEVEDVIGEIRGLDLDSTPPIELMRRVESWRDRLEDSE